MISLFKYEGPITENHLQLSAKAWSAFRSGSPEKWYALLTTDTKALPFLEGAVFRLLEEYPGSANGLSRTARQFLEIILQGEKHPGKVFALYQESEQRRFLGDLSFWVIIREFLESSPALLTLSEGKELTLPIKPDQELTITQVAKDVLSGKSNWLEINELDHWIGGVHLTPDNIWCWDSGSGSVIKRA